MHFGDAFPSILIERIRNLDENSKDVIAFYGGRKSWKMCCEQPKDSSKCIDNQKGNWSRNISMSFFLNKLEKDFDLQVRYLYFKINFNFFCTAKFLTFLDRSLYFKMKINLKKIRMILVIENCLWKSNLCTFWGPGIMFIDKIQ